MVEHWGEDTATSQSYFDCFAAPTYTIRNTSTPGCGGERVSLKDEAKELDGAGLARTFFQSSGFYPEKLLWDALGPAIVRRGLLGYTEAEYGYGDLEESP